MVNFYNRTTGSDGVASMNINLLLVSIILQQVMQVLHCMEVLQLQI